MTDALANLLALLDLEPVEADRFSGRSPQSGWHRVFGGQVVAQALVAAGRTVEGRRAHSLHAYFLLPGDPAVPILYEVERIRDGRSFTTRRVVAMQHGRAIFALTASFQVEEPGLDHAATMPAVPPPESLESLGSDAMLSRLPDFVRRYWERERPIDLRPVDLERYRPDGAAEPSYHVWLRVDGPLSDDPALHQAVLAYASDFTLLDTALAAHRRTVHEPTIQAASLDHALWFHRPVRADQWLLYAQDSPSASNARGFSRGQIFTQDGLLVASVAQEGLIRRVEPKA